VSYRERIDRWIRFDSVGTLRYESLEDIATEADATEERLRAALVVAERDAARYLWLRDLSVPPHNFYLSVPVEFDGVRYTPAEVDAAIDAAITQQTKETKK
jgi:hypothetical protein